MLLSSLDADDVVGLQYADDYVEDPEEYKDSWADVLGDLGSAQLGANALVPAPEHDDENGNQGLAAEERHGKANPAKKLFEFASFFHFFFLYISL